MKSDFKRFRRLRMTAVVLLIAAAVCFACCMVFVRGVVGVGFGITALIVIGFSAAICEYAAYDCLICPHCGQRAVKSHREFPRDKVNNERFRAICKSQPFECVHCGQKIETF